MQSLFKDLNTKVSTFPPAFSKASAIVYSPWVPVNIGIKTLGFAMEVFFRNYIPFSITNIFSL